VRVAIRAWLWAYDRRRIGKPRALRACGAVAALLLALGLAGCGKKGPPQPPPGVSNVYPRPYPRE
jgi:Prokaryotic lipoprotein-attachment site